MKKVVLVAQDVAPSLAFEMLWEVIPKESRGAKILGHGKKIEQTHSLTEVITSSSVVLIGMSSSPELSVLEMEATTIAQKLGVPYFFYGDRFGTVGRPWFEPYRSGAAGIFVINDREAEKASQWYPTNVPIIVSGNPAWEEFAFPSFTRDEVRNKLNAGAEEVVILVPGGKIAGINCTLMSAVIDAAQELKRPCRVYYSSHPGDRTNMATYVELGTFGSSSKVLVSVLAPDVIGSTVAVIGADVVIDSATTIGIQAAHLRIPVINFFTEVTMRRLELVEGSRSWELNDLGVSVRVDSNPIQLAVMMMDVLNSETPTSQAIRRCQTEVYPQIPQKGHAVSVMAQTLLG